MSQQPGQKEEPEAAGQEQETAEVFMKAMKPQVADFDKHDKVAKVFDYYDMTGFAAQYASQQTAALREENERLRSLLKKLLYLTETYSDPTTEFKETIMKALTKEPKQETPELWMCDDCGGMHDSRIACRCKWRY